MTATASASKPVLVAFSFLAALNVMNAGLGALELVSAQVAGAIALGTAAITAGLAYYVQGQVTPADAVAARVTGDGQLVAGPAAGLVQTGTPIQLSADAAPPLR